MFGRIKRFFGLQPRELEVEKSLNELPWKPEVRTEPTLAPKKSRKRLRNKWTKREIGILKRRYKKTSADALALILTRHSVSSIRSKVSELGMTKR